MNGNAPFEGPPVRVAVSFPSHWSIAIATPGAWKTRVGMNHVTCLPPRVLEFH